MVRQSSDVYFIRFIYINKIGYQMRTHIAKALQKWSKAIQRAVKTYNTAASALDPPRQTIDWNTVSHYKFLEKFPLLRNTWQDLTGKRWALPAVREMMKQWRRICRAHEEIIRCNIEVRRLPAYLNHWWRDKFPENTFPIHDSQANTRCPQGQHYTKKQHQCAIALQDHTNLRSQRLLWDGISRCQATWTCW